MKNFKKAAAIIVSGVMVFSFAGCSKKDTGSAAESGANTNAVEEVQENKVLAASLKIQEVDNMNCQTDMSFTMSIDGETMDVSSLGKATVFNNPLKMKMNMIQSIGEEIEIDYYMESAENGMVDMYFGNDEMGWMKQQVDMSYVEELKGNADFYLSYAENFESAGEDTVNGEKAEKFEGVMKADDINEILAETNLDSMVASVGGDVSNLESLFEGLEDIPMTIWISNESGYPVKYDMDVSQMLQVVLENTFSAFEGTEGMEEIPEISINNAIISMTYSDFNEAEDFEIPAEIIESATATN
jgi:hypothetical protein